MRKYILVLMAGILTLAMLACCSIAETAGFDVTQYSYEELLEIKEQVDARLVELEKQQAMESKDREISFEQEELLVFVGDRGRLRANVERLTEDAPRKTKLVWTSSDPEIARVNVDGYVSAVAGGDAVITACADDNPYISASYTLHSAVPVENITLYGAEEPLMLGNDEETASVRIGFSIEPEDAYFQTVVWKSSNEEIATIDEEGQVRGLQPGKVTITATSAEESPAGKKPKTATCNVIVTQQVTGMELNETEIAMDLRQKVKLEVKVTPENADNKSVVFTSGNPEIAEVDAGGNIKAIAPGECDILCEAADGGAEATCHVTVSRLVNAITVKEPEIRMGIGATKTVETIVFPQDATNTALNWSSSNVFVARASNGVIEAVGQGECEITCTAADGSNVSATIHVVVPAFGVEQTSYTVEEKSGLVIPVLISQAGTEITCESSSELFTAEMIAADQVKITPIAAGNGEVALAQADGEGEKITLQITIADSAVYNEVSYPRIAYEELAQHPETYEGSQMSLYGQVLQIENGEEAGEVVLTVGTGGKKYNDKVFRVKCRKELLPEETEAGSYLTIYGLYRNETVYSEALGSNVTVPAMTAEKIMNN